MTRKFKLRTIAIVVLLAMALSFALTACDPQQPASAGHTVTFVGAGEGGADVVVRADGKLAASDIPAVPEKEHFSNDGKWYVADNDGQPTSVIVDANFTVNADVKAVGKYAPIMFTVTFVGGGASGQDYVANVQDGSKLTALPQIPVKEHCTNDGKWYVADGQDLPTSTVIDLDFVVNANVRAVPKYADLLRSVTFKNAAGGADVVRQVVDGQALDMAQVPEAQVIQGQTFKFWALEGQNVAFDFGQAITADVTLTAVYDQLYSATYFSGVYGDVGVTGSAPQAVQLAEGQSLTLPANPFDRQHYAFVGWKPQRSVNGIWTDISDQPIEAGGNFQMPAYAVRIAAAWQAKFPFEGQVEFEGNITIGSATITAVSVDSQTLSSGKATLADGTQINMPRISSQDRDGLKAYRLATNPVPTLCPKALIAFDIQGGVAYVVEMDGEAQAGFVAVITPPQTEYVQYSAEGGLDMTQTVLPNWKLNSVTLDMLGNDPYARICAYWGGAEQILDIKLDPEQKASDGAYFVKNLHGDSFWLLVDENYATMKVFVTSLSNLELRILQGTLRNPNAKEPEYVTFKGFLNLEGSDKVRYLNSVTFDVNGRLTKLWYTYPGYVGEDARGIEAVTEEADARGKAEGAELMFVATIDDMPFEIYLSRIDDKSVMVYSHLLYSTVFDVVDPTLAQDVGDLSAYQWEYVFYVSKLMEPYEFEFGSFNIKLAEVALTANCDALIFIQPDGTYHIYDEVKDMSKGYWRCFRLDGNTLLYVEAAEGSGGLGYFTYSDQPGISGHMQSWGGNTVVNTDQYRGLYNFSIWGDKFKG